jgi:hypothetical protein
LGTLQAKLQGWRENDNRNLDIQIEDEEPLDCATGDEGADDTEKILLLARNLSPKKPVSLPEGEVAKPDIIHIQAAGAGLVPEYLPLMSKLRSASDLDAIQILRDIRSIPVRTKGLAALSLLDSDQSRPHPDPQTSQYAEQVLGGVESSVAKGY